MAVNRIEGKTRRRRTSSVVDLTEVVSGRSVHSLPPATIGKAQSISKGTIIKTDFTDHRNLAIPIGSNQMISDSIRNAHP